MTIQAKESKSDFKQQFNNRLVRFTVNTLKLCRTLQEERLLWGVVDQVTRSAASIGANVSEASGSGSLKGYKNYFEIALKSANETRYWFTVLAEFEIGDDHTRRSLESELEEIIKILNASIKTMKSRVNGHSRNV